MKPISPLTKALAAARSLLYIFFNGWQTPNDKLTLTSIYIHYLDEKGHVVDYMLALPVQLGQHSGINYAEVIGNVLDTFKITKEQLGYFVTIGLRGSHNKQSLLRPEPRLDITSILPII
jgi:hypothetical protein